MAWFVAGCILVAIGLCAGGFTAAKRLFKSLLPSVVIMVAGVLVGVALIFISMLQHVEPGYAGKAYTVSGQQTELHAGYNYVAPWNKVYRLSLRSIALSFVEGTAVDDAFGAQSATGDYLQGIAIMTVRIDPARLDEYISRFGFKDLDGNSVINKTLKAEMKKALERAVSGKETKFIMNNKDEVSRQAVTYAAENLAGYPFVVDTMAFQDFQASDEYEKAIRAQATLRMDIDRAALQESLNAQDAQNNRIRAEGEAAVKKLQAENEAVVLKLQADNAMAVALVKANQDAQTKQIQAEADAGVVMTQAKADADASILKATAEAQGLEALGAVYAKYTSLLELKDYEVRELVVQRWNGVLVPSFGGMSSLNFADLTDVIQKYLPNTQQVTAAPTLAN